MTKRVLVTAVILWACLLGGCGSSSQIGNSVVVEFAPGTTTAQMRTVLSACVRRDHGATLSPAVASDPGTIEVPDPLGAGAQRVLTCLRAGPFVKSADISV